jgi:hypothetical protein
VIVDEGGVGSFSAIGGNSIVFGASNHCLLHRRISFGWVVGRNVFVLSDDVS